MARIAVLSQAERVMLWIAVGVMVAGVWATYFTVNPTNPENMQGGGDMVCITATPNPTGPGILGTNTPNPISSSTATAPTIGPTPSPTLTATPVLIMPSPTKVTVTTTQTAVSAKCNQSGAEHAVSAEGLYRVTGLWQNVRTSPTTAISNIIGSAQNGAIFEVYWTAYDNRGVLWISPVQACNRWLSTTLGVYTP